MPYWLEGVWYALAYRLRRLLEYLKGVWGYYGHRDFRNTDLALVLNYLGANPYYVARRFAAAKGEKELYTYGETPLTTLAEICQRCGLTSKDVVFELGCGRGRACFWLRTVFGCQQVIGIDYNPYFVKLAQYIAREKSIQGLEFRCEDILHADLSGATVIYLYGSVLDADFIERLAARVAQLPRGTKVLTVSYSLQEYATKPLFETVEVFSARFTWGVATVYWQQVVGDPSSQAT